MSQHNIKNTCVYKSIFTNMIQQFKIARKYSYKYF